MKVLLLMDPFIRVPPQVYGGIERVIADLANGLCERGHAVTLWAAPGSQTRARLHSFGQEGEWTRWSNLRNTIVLAWRFFRSRSDYDLVHNFGRMAYLTPILRWDLPKVQTYMRPVNPANMRKAVRLGAKRLHYTAVSGAIRNTGQPGGGEWSVIYNCAPVQEYRLNVQVNPDTAPLAFLGRLERCKGVHNAIAVAKTLGRPLQIAGNISNLPDQKEYFHREVQPQIDGKLINYLGPVNNDQKNQLLGSAAAMLMPVEWEEPFPIVLPEALLCGCPVVAFARGGMPEGIDHGKTGFLCHTVAEMCELVGRLGEIDRAHCRAEAERRFSDRAVVDEYGRLYRKLIAHSLE
jgi:glycosyltransferase involved in cell wall biosynthesis